MTHEKSDEQLSSDEQFLSVNETPARDQWIEEVSQNFVSRSKANRKYYQLILETLWPLGHNHLPGPIVSMTTLRQVINNYRGQPYNDPARRIRELQGEEGIVGIVRLGSGKQTKYQLVHTKVEKKRDPRTGLSSKDWAKVIAKYNSQCAVCGRRDTEIRLDQDHKIPRLRGGSDDFSNWQPLCKECNNFKSTACRGCELDCRQCPWAFPEKYAPIKLSPLNIERVRSLSRQKGESPTELLNAILEKYFQDRSE
ncbi:HNH endonuclease signature motif containing protein [Limnoraphis robusta Tam1]|uniref:HNH endonuclease signature motif containing protein n=1 Tax=Limnoraphis robusta CCNP1315 TaxID=3110306 RepID=A0ABU5TWB2_9CYAN|nr:HNH endonuclease signature motif containing protein [Limnoraphis robusta]MEA5501268.1 HNH endonuclease signature motif containing protein [Limnoraphis robusta BA-68 BA1]MEA5518946.1 HNH endonuclease signature motif containing protein [Limnoraphis robusta CCNP1315]MEA5538366.1 HNH endonuclease signature motif containing protein [Limnoraphis robusta Tam1]MEA5548416.1 HNH endonuclease signature motif containing protein [Limnoraphis robusta CCNP1324]